MRVIFSKIADFSYEEIQEFVAEHWTEKEIEVFVNETKYVVKSLKEGKFLMYQQYSGNIRLALIGNNHVRMFFRKDNVKEIRVLYFFDMRDNPKKLNHFLK